MSHPPRWLPVASRVASHLVAPLPANRYADPARSIPGSGKDPSRSAHAPSARGSEVHRTHRDSVQPLALSLPLPSLLSFGFMCIRVNQTSVLFSVAGCPPSCFCTDARDPSYNCFPSVFSLASLERDISSQSLTQRRTFSKSLFGLVFLIPFSEIDPLLRRPQTFRSEEH